jgi:hypothetical protein
MPRSWCAPPRMDGTRCTHPALPTPRRAAHPAAPEVGIPLITEVMDYAPPELTWREGWILLVLAETANDKTRECWPGYDGDSARSQTFRRRVRCSRSQFYTVLKSLIDHKVIETTQRGQKHRQAHYRIAPLRPPLSVPETGTLKSPSGSAEPGHGDDSQGPGSEFSGSRFEALSVPETGTPSPHTPQDSSSLSAHARIVRSAAVVAESEERDLIDWITKTHAPRGIGWWRTVARNGDLEALADQWRTSASPGRGTSLSVLPELIECARCGAPTREPVSAGWLCRECRTEVAV